MVNISKMIFENGNNMDGMDGMKGMDHGSNGWGSMWWMWVIPILLVIGISVAIYLSSKKSSNSNGSVTVQPTENAKAILADRFAKGEIDNDEYQERLSNLS